MFLSINKAVLLQISLFFLMKAITKEDKITIATNNIKGSYMVRKTPKINGCRNFENVGHKRAA